VGSDVESEIALIPKKSVEALIDVAQTRSARMIVVGSHGEAPLKGVIIGSTPYKLLHLSPCPVLVVPGSG
jgi:nucleotide-binding universal stress UspA family protein